MIPCLSCRRFGECLHLADYDRGKRLTPNSVFATIYQQSFHQCRRQCAFRTSCLVFTYTSSNGICELGSHGYGMESVNDDDVLSSPTTWTPGNVNGQCSGHVCPEWMMCVGLTSGSNICIQPESDFVPATTTTTPPTTTTTPLSTTTTPQTTTTTPPITTSTLSTTTTTPPTTTTTTPPTITTTAPQITTTTPQTTTTAPPVTTTTQQATTTTPPATTTTPPTTTTAPLLTTTAPSTTTTTPHTTTTAPPVTTTTQPATTTTPPATTTTLPTTTTTSPTTTSTPTITTTTPPATTTTPPATTTITPTTTTTTISTTPTTTTLPTTEAIFNISSYQVLNVFGDFASAVSACAAVGGIIPDFKIQSEIDGILPLLQNTTVLCNGCPVDGIVHENSSVIITSPNYPQDYGCFVECTCPLKAESSDLKLQLNLFVNNLEHNCDYLVIYDGPNTTSPGFGKFYGLNLNHILVSSTDEVLLRFTTDLSVTRPGFTLTVTTVGASVNSSGHTTISNVRALSKQFWIGGSMSGATQSWIFSDGSEMPSSMVPYMDYGWDYYNSYDYYYENLPLVDFRRAIKSTGAFQAVHEDWQSYTLCGLP